MTRSWNVPGESMCYLRGGGHLQSGYGGTTSELGLCVGNVVITPTYFGKDLNVDDLARGTVDVMNQLAEVNVRMRLAYFDPNLLAIGMRESVNGFLPTGQWATDPPVIQTGPGPVLATDGIMGPAGMQLGRGLDPYTSGNRLMTLTVRPMQAQYPWRFIAGYFDGPTIPLGADAQIVDVSFRCIPYARYSTSGFVGPPSNSLFTQDAEGSLIFSMVSGEIVSSGLVLYDHCTPHDLPT